MDVNESYRELGLRADCSDAELKSAWRRLAARWHPDRNDSPQALRKIQRINRALEEIMAARRDGVPATEDTGFSADTVSPSQPPPRDATAEAPRFEHEVELSLEEAIAGCVRELQGEVPQECVPCGGSGTSPHWSACSACDGEGRARQPMWFAWMAAGRQPCDACEGSGRLRPGCKACEGSGRAAPRRYRCRVRIPAGTRDGDALHVAARLRGSEPLDLRVRIAVRPHPFFSLQEDGSVRCELPVDGFAWMAGRWIEVPTPGGLQQMRLRRGFLSYRIKGQGMPQGADGERADCIVTVEPLFPESLSREQEALVERLSASNAQPALAAWEARVREWTAQRQGSSAD